MAGVAADNEPIAEEACELIDVIEHELPPLGVVNPCKERRW
jgi:hypothetical protein